MHYKIVLKSLVPVSHETRKKYLKSFYGSHHDGKRGSIDKFCRAIGFKPIMDDWYTQGSVIIDAEIPSPESYQKPAQMLFQGLHVELENNSIASFVVPITSVVHPNSKFSYNSKELCHKLVNFMKKVYPEVIIEESIVETSEQSDDEFVLDFIYQSLDFQDSLYTVECSTSRMLTEDELAKIYQKLNGATAYNWHIEQFYCETCASYHPHAPFHTEVVYDM